MLECVINISEGGNPSQLNELSAELGPDLLDLHSDADHNRSVFTLAGEDPARVLTDKTVETAKHIAKTIRTNERRTLGLQVGAHAQVSMNLIDHEVTGPAEAYDAVAALAPIDHAELVGLVPARALARIPRERWSELDLGGEKTIEWRLAERNRRLADRGA